jgi:hypothetical protein
MPAWILLFLGGLVQFASSFVGRVLIYLGITALVFTGVDAGVAGVQSTVQTAVNGLPAQALAVITALRVDKIISVLFSAVVTKLTFKGLASGVVRGFAATKAPFGHYP